MKIFKKNAENKTDIINELKSDIKELKEKYYELIEESIHLKNSSNIQFNEASGLSQTIQNSYIIIIIKFIIFDRKL